ncbi:hypothetical protein G4Y79_14660 [Phototrophicus methaneseepsis]|uniref:Uncharacterized protein n=1 Tax=Phototrophicus methaneseepsis TaxID=2710758 RepID=A0A7S8E5X0_9CHLR|nr:hypothetical protein [Phototrophicus methaneseepsis]QPC80947.1 hypothetical protein G4Y79_14660 [Phototrophicus methaneseepsis]
MSLEGILFIAAMVLFALVGIALPFIGQRRKRGTAQLQHIQRTRDELITSYERVLSTIRDLDEDYQLAKINQGDYQEERTYWSEYGVRLLQMLESDKPSVEILQTPGVKPNEAEAALDHAVEEAIRNYRMALESASLTGSKL